MFRASFDVGQSENATNVRSPKSKLDRWFKRFLTDGTQKHELLCDTITRTLILFSEKKKKRKTKDLHSKETLTKTTSNRKIELLVLAKIPRRLFAKSIYQT